MLTTNHVSSDLELFFRQDVPDFIKHSLKEVKTQFLRPITFFILFVVHT